MNKELIAVVNHPNGPMVLTELNDKPRVFATAGEAREALRGHILVRSFGCELFELGTGTPL